MEATISRECNASTETVICGASEVRMLFPVLGNLHLAQSLRFLLPSMIVRHGQRERRQRERPEQTEEMRNLSGKGVLQEKTGTSQTNKNKEQKKRRKATMT